MIYQLIRHNSIPARALFFSLAAAAVGTVAPRSAMQLALPFVLVTIAMLPRGGSRFEAGLPVTGRDILLARIIPTFALTLLPIIVGELAAIISGKRGMGAMPSLIYAAILALVILLPYVVDPRALDGPSNAVLIYCGAGIAVATTTALYFLQLPAVLLLFATAAVASLALLWSRIPACLQLASQTLEAGGDLSTTSAPVRRFRFSAMEPLAPALRSIFSKFVVFWIALTAFNGFGSASLLILFLSPGTVWTTTRIRSRWLTALPFSNRARLLLNLLPLVACLSAWMIGQSIGLRTLPGYRSAAMASHVPGAYHGGEFDKAFPVSLEYWVPATPLEPLAIVAPWGESAQPDTMTVLGTFLSNPYTVGTQNSARFSEWQFTRATTEIFGKAIAKSAFDSRSPSDKLSLRSLSTRFRLLVYGAVLAAMLGLLWIVELGMWYGFAARGLPGKILKGATSAPLFVLLALDLYYLHRNDVEIIVPMTRRFLWQLADTMPPHNVLVVMLSLIPVALFYILLEWQFARSEPPKARATLNQSS